jgi:hypothetical protein
MTARRAIRVAAAMLLARLRKAGRMPGRCRRLIAIALALRQRAALWQRLAQQRRDLRLLAGRLHHGVHP